MENIEKVIEEVIEREETEAVTNHEAPKEEVEND